jgi:hypothetical protein
MSGKALSGRPHAAILSMPNGFMARPNCVGVFMVGFPAFSCVSRPSFQPVQASANLIFQFSCKRSVRLIRYLLKVTMTIGQIAGCSTGQIKSS